MRTIPDGADFGIYINFAKGMPFPQRVFQAADEMITAFSTFDKLLVDSFDTSIEPILLLEDIEAGSMLVWLRNALSGIDDQALKELDVKQQFGAYLVKGKYLAIDFINRRVATNDKKRIEQLREDLSALARATPAIRHSGFR